MAVLTDRAAARPGRLLPRTGCRCRCRWRPAPCRRARTPPGGARRLAVEAADPTAGRSAPEGRVPVAARRRQQPPIRGEGQRACGDEWPATVRTCSPVATSQSRTGLSRERCRPSGCHRARTRWRASPIASQSGELRGRPVSRSEIRIARSSIVPAAEASDRPSGANARLIAAEWPRKDIRRGPIRSRRG